MERELILESEMGDQIRVILNEQTDSCNQIVLLCHGFMSSSESQTNRLLTEKLSNMNVATCRFDFYGHGEDKGTFKELTLTRCLKQVDAVLSWIRKNGYAAIVLMGSSYGGLTAILSAACHREVTAVALKCPVSDYPPIWRGLLGKAGMSNWKADEVLSFATPGGRARLGYAFYEDLLNYDAYQESLSIEAPVLIVHGDDDRDVPVEQSLKLKETLDRNASAKADLITIPGADHQFTKPEDFDQMIEHLMRWFISIF